MANLVPYKNKWLSSYETLGFNTKDGDLDFGQYALDEHKERIYIRIKPKNEAQFESVGLDYDVSGLTKVKIKDHAYYHTFRSAEGKTVRIPTDYSRYWNLSRVKNYPQPERIEAVSEIPIFLEDSELKDTHRSIAHDSSTATEILSFVTSFSWGHTCTGNDLTLLVGVSANDLTEGDRSVDSVTYNSDSLTLINGAEEGESRSELWYRAAPDSGSSYTIGVTMMTPPGSCDTVCAGATSLTGTAATPIGANDTAHGNSGFANPATVDVITTEDNSWVHDVIIAPDLTVGADQIERWNVAGSIDGGGSTEATTDKGTVTMSWSVGYYANWAIVAAEIKEKAAAPSTSIKTICGVAIASIEKFCGIAKADIEAVAGVSNTS